MMGYDGWGFFGVHVLWWLFWIVVIGAAAGRETPLEFLRRRYAAGEISKEEYEERKRVRRASHRDGGESHAPRRSELKNAMDDVFQQTSGRDERVRT